MTEPIKTPVSTSVSTDNPADVAAPDKPSTGAAQTNKPSTITAQPGKPSTITAQTNKPSTIGGFEVTDNKDGSSNIHKLPIFNLGKARGKDFNEEWAKGVMENHSAVKSEDGSRPSLIVGHTEKGQGEKEAVGRVDNLFVSERTRKNGSKIKSLFADIRRVPASLMEKLRKGAFPSRSVEITHKSKRLLALALLGGTRPFHKLPPLAFEGREGGAFYFEDGQVKPDKSMVLFFEEDMFGVSEKVVMDDSPGILEIKNQVSAQLEELIPSKDGSFWGIEEIFVGDSPNVVVSMDGRFWRYAISVQDGVVSIDPQAIEMKRRFIPVQSDSDGAAFREVAVFTELSEEEKERNKSMDQVLKLEKEKLELSHSAELASKEIEMFKADLSRSSETVTTLNEQLTELQAKFSEVEKDRDEKTAKIEEIQGAKTADARDSFLEIAVKDGKINKAQSTLYSKFWDEDEKEIREHVDGLKANAAFNAKETLPTGTDGDVEDARTPMTMSDIEALAEANTDGDVSKYGDEVKRLVLKNGLISG